jgi:integrase/recombinase XerD
MRENGITSVDGFSNQEIIAYRDSLRGSQMDTSINQKILKINQFNNYLIEVGLPKEHYPNKELVIPINQRSPLRIADPDDYERLKSAIRKEGIPRDELIFHLVFELGLKPSEIVGLKINCVIWNEESVGITRPMLRLGDKSLVEITEVTFNLISQSIRSMDINDEYLFEGYKNRPLHKLSINSIIGKYCDLACIEKLVSPRSLRNAYVRSLLERDCSTDEICKKLRMSKHNFAHIYGKLIIKHE